MLTNKLEVKSDDLDESQGRSHVPFVNQRLSFYSYFLILLLIGLWVVVFVLSINYAILYPIFFLPLIPLLVWWKRNTDTTEIDLVLRLFLLGFAFAIPVWVIESVVITGGVAIYSASINPDCKECVIFFILPFILLIMLAEEYTKYVLLILARQWRPHFQHTRASLIYSMSTALGFAISQSVFYSFLVMLQLRRDNSDVIVDITAVIGFIIFLFLPLHCLTGYLQGLGVVRQVLNSPSLSSVSPLPMTTIEPSSSSSSSESSSTSISSPALTSEQPISDDPILPTELPFPADVTISLQPCGCSCLSILIFPTLFRTLFFWQISIWLILITKGILWLSLALPISVIFFLVVIGYIKKYESLLPFEYRQRVGYLMIPGYTEN